MQVYSCPQEVPYASPDFANYNFEAEERRIEQHKEALKAWLLKAGYKGKHTGKTVSFPAGDGAAQYMLADGPKSCLIHLPYGDAWQYRDVKFLPKAEIVKRLDRQEKLASIFASKEKSAA